MKLYQELSNKLRRLSITDFMLVKWVYLVLGILIASVYPPIFFLSVWAYLILTLIAALPLLLLIASFKGDMVEKTKQYLANNNPSNQILTLISCSALGIAIAVLFPVLSGLRWFYYIMLMIALAFTPIKKAFLSKPPKK